MVTNVFNHPSIYDYEVENNLLIFRKFPVNHFFFCIEINSFNLLISIKSSLTKEFSKHRPNFLLYFNPLEKKNYFWCSLKCKKKEILRQKLTAICLKFADKINLLSGKSLIDAFFIHPMLQDPNILLENNEIKDYFKVCLNPQQNLFVYKIIPHVKKISESDLNNFEKFAEFITTAKIYTIIQLKIIRETIIDLSIFIFIEKLIKRNIFQSFLDSFKVSKGFTIEKINFREFTQLLNKKIIKKKFMMDTNKFCSIFKPLTIMPVSSKNLNFRGYNGDLIEFIAENKRDLNKLSPHLFALRDYYFYVLKFSNFDDFVNVLSNFYPRSQKIFVISENRDLLNIIEIRTSIKKLKKVSILDSNADKFIQLFDELRISNYKIIDEYSPLISIQ